MIKFFCFLLGFLFYFFSLSWAEVENLKILDDIIISDNETKIFSLDEYFTNSNLKFNITNPYANIFKITLSESFNNLHNFELFEYSSLMRVKNLESLHSFLLVFEKALVVIHWEQTNSVITTTCSKVFIYSSAWGNPVDCGAQPQWYFNDVKCYDAEEIFLKDYNPTLTYLVLDCDITSWSSSQNFLYYSVLANGKNIKIFRIDNQGLSTSNMLNSTRRILFDNSTNRLYRYSPYSLKQTPENQSTLQYYSHTTSFRFSQDGVIPNTTQYLESIALVNGTILILDYQNNIYIYNFSKSNYTDTFSVQSNEINIQISYYQSRLFILTNASVYRLMFSDQLKFILVYQLNITSTTKVPDIPHMTTQTVDYLYILYDKFIQIMKIDDSSSKKMMDSAFVNELPSYFNRSKYILKFPDLSLKNAFSIWVLQNSFSELDNHRFKIDNYLWSLNITQIQKKLLVVYCCNDSNFDPTSSMQNFFFNLTVNDQNMTINIYYWNIKDGHLYFDPAMMGIYTQNLTYSFDSENVLIPYTNWVVGPLKNVRINDVHPICSNFRVDCYKIFNVSFDYLQNNENIDVSFESLVIASVGLNFTINSTKMTMYWQTSKDLTFYIIDCFLDSNYLIEDCIVSFRKDTNSLRFKSAFSYRHFHIINTENLFWVNDTNPDYNEDEIHFLIDPATHNAAKCLNVYFYQKNDIIFCLIESYLIFFKLRYSSQNGSALNDSIFIDPFKYDNYTDTYFQMDNKVIYTDFIEIYNFFLLRTGPNLIIYEIIWDEIDFQFTITQKAVKLISANADLFVLNQDMPIIVVIDYETDVIKQYTIRVPSNFTFLRTFPSFSYDFISSFACNNQFLCIKVLDKNNSYIVIYNVTEPTSKLLRYKIPYNNSTDYVFPVVTNENKDSDAFFHNLFRSSSIFAVIDPIYGLSLRVYKVCDIVANVAEIFKDPKIVNQKFYTYTLSVKFTNDLMREMIFFQVIVNISLLNSVITLDKNSSAVRPFINPPWKGSKYILNLTDTPFAGPVQNYKIINSFFINNNDNFYYDFYPYLDKSLDFESDYDTARDAYGNFKEAVSKEGVLFILSEKNITFHDVNNEYTVIYFDKMDGSCFDMYIHPSLNTVYVFCKSNGIMHLRCYDYVIGVKIPVNKTTNSTNKIQIEANVSCIDLIPFKGAFESYVSVVLSDYHFFFLIDEGYYQDLHKKKKKVYIYNLPQQTNNYTVGSPLIFSDKDFKDEYFMMSDAVDIQSYFIDKIGNSSYYVILILMKRNLEIVNCNFTITDNSSELNVLQKLNTDYQNFIQDNFNQVYVFYTLTLLSINMSYNTNDDIFGNFSVVYILSSNFHIYEFTTTVINKTSISTSANHIYTKYYSCIFTDTVRPRKFKLFLGSFCTKTEITAGIVENVLNYFVLHKINANNDLYLAPVLTLPIYLKNYNFQFIAKKTNYSNEPDPNYSNDVLILPSFSSLFTEFELTSGLSLFLRKNQNALTTTLMAYNDISNASITLQILLTSEDDDLNYTSLTLAIVLSVLAVFLLFGLAIFLYLRRKRRKAIMETNDESEFIDNEYYLLKPGMNVINDLNYRDSDCKVIKDSTTHGSQNARAGSFLRVKQKNEKWIES